MISIVWKLLWCYGENVFGKKFDFVYMIVVKVGLWFN